MFDLTNKVALVTGGRRGMGKSHALALASQGAKVVVADIDARECLAVAEEIKSKGGGGYELGNGRVRQIRCGCGF